MFKIFIARKIPGNGIAMLKRHGFKVEVYEKDQEIPRAELLQRIRGCSGVITMLTEKVDQEFLEAAGTSLRIVANYAVGYDNFDLKALRAADIKASNTALVLNDAVAEHTVTLMFAIAKRLCEADKFARAGKYRGWAPELLLGTELHGKTLGIIGLGRIGYVVAEHCTAMHMHVVYNDVKPNPDFEKKFGAKYLSKDQLLKHADFVSLHVPLLPSTRHLIGKKEFKMMKKTAYLVNTSRGPVVDEKALAAALKSGTIRGAAIDVFEFEPKVTPTLTKLDNVILTPHTASATIEARSAMGELAAQNIIAALTGKPLPSPVS